jgi:pyruvate dehydrogenase E2 component (dihydrolipoamide acetyltransferase)
MALPVLMPRFDPEGTPGRVVRWLRRVGDEVAEGEALAELECGKAGLELEAFGSGVLRAIVVPEGATAEPFALLAVLAGPDEPLDDVLAQARGVGSCRGAVGSSLG